MTNPSIPDPKGLLADRVLAGNVQAAARLITLIEDDSPRLTAELDVIYPHTGKAHIIGITGSPGIGKSTTINCLIEILRGRGMKVGVIAIDPTSPFTGGALLGDRIRMQQHSLDKGVFIRSLASRGWSGGLAKAAINAIHVMDAMGMNIIMVETVGVGQSEVDVARFVDTAVVLLSPGTGDEIQVAKAGIMEIADIFAINKADKPGAKKLAVEVEAMLDMKTYPPAEWKPGIILTEAINGKGIPELADAILKHRQFLITSGLLEKRRKQRAKQELIGAIEDSVREHFYRMIEHDQGLDKLVDSFVRRKANPRSTALRVIHQFTRQFNGARDNPES
ncbi:MAG: methylmalonyl Co-A mutase-associated GTPase MeaB [Dehalococcoidales bacterium]|nr:methylmalonyl Co-A mutase-associated GTPase MeaB [Dehalococcoidales bacterium]